MRQSAAAWLFLVLFCWPPTSRATLYMIMEYNTDGTVALNTANFTIHTQSMEVTLLGCDYGYYDYYLLYPPLVPSPKTQVTPFDCRPCACSEFDSLRIEEYVIVS